MSPLPTPALEVLFQERYHLGVIGCGLAEAAMVGNRPDQDLGPARVLGMRTIWLQRSTDTGFDLPGETSPHDLTVRSLEELARVFQQG